MVQFSRSSRRTRAPSSIVRLGLFVTRCRHRPTPEPGLQRRADQRRTARNRDDGLPLWRLYNSLLELRDQGRQGFWLFISGEVTASQPLGLKDELAEPFLCEVNLPVFKGILVAAAHQERELIAIGLEEATEVEPIALRLVISDKAC